MEKFKSYITPRNLLIFNLILIILFFLFSCVVDGEEDFFDPITAIENIISRLPENTPTLDFTYRF
ncbi:hypothetical protein [Winogradskyella sp.]|uniref:hypothetical protein n=1 Tax=Winogradskyella sp. TaxID=1883156 RepID=UPI00262020D9|nr:hypothetical protein [Winogradskyella sp.]